MELRSCDQMHFIQAVQGGLVTKFLNVTHGRPALTFKKVKDLYEAAELLQKLRPKDEFESLPFESDRIEVKSPCLPLADRRTIKREPDASHLFCNDSDKRIDSELDGLDLCSMTLKQITERCNLKKRKHSKYVELSNETGESSSFLKSDNSNFQKEEEDLDLKEPLSSWKSKHSKNVKVKKKRMKNHVLTSSQSAKSIVKSEQVPSDEVLPQCSGDLPAINIKETTATSSCLTTDYSNFQKVEEDLDLKEPLSSWKSKHSKNVKVKKKRMKNHVSTSSPSAKLIVKSEQVPSDEVLPGYSTEPAINMKDEVSEPDCLDHQNVICVSGDSSLLCHEPEGSCQMMFNEPCEKANACVLETQIKISFTKEPQYCATNEVCYEYTEPEDPKSGQIVSASAWDSMVVGNMVTTSHEHSDLPVPESEMKGYTQPVDGDFCLETISSTADHSSHVSGTPQSSSPMKDILLHINNDIKVPGGEVLPQSSGDLWPATNMKVEVSESDSLGCQRFICNSSDPTCLCDELEGSCGMVSGKLCEAANGSVSETQVSISLTEEPQFCVTNEVGYDYMELTDPKSVKIVRASCKDSIVANTVTNHNFADLPVLESDIEVYTHPILDDISSGTIYSVTGHSSCISGVSQSSSPITIHKIPQGVELGHGGDTYVFEDGIAAKLPSNPKVGAIDSCTSEFSLSPDSCLDSVEDDSSTAKVKQPQSSSPRTIHEIPQSKELGHGGDAYLFGDGIASELPSNPKVDVVSRLTSDCSSSPDCFMHSVEDDSPTPEMKQLQNSAFADADINVSARIYPLTDELMTSVGFEYHHRSNLQHPPARLYPTRKAISPTSQERLLKAMDFNELTDNEYYKCTGEFYIGKNNFSSVEGPNQIREDEFSIKPRQIIRKQRSSKRGFPPKAVHKAPYLSYTVPRFSTGCTSIQSCTQSAIEFSQQQMKDFECLAMKLTKELQSMKDILEERLLPEDCPALSLKYKVDRARMAINNATKVEESTRRWLSMMARDCKRFCKIMGLTETGSGSSGNLVQNERKNSTSADEASGVLVDQLQRLAGTGSASSGNVVHKARKKITFADEAGGKLCHVRVFDDDTESVFESNDEKQELLITEQ
ncbi:hypothetical protein F2P56_012606 [Juglans regia]|uniref:Uncharacterized protein LOC108995563 n=2 Tax=Juglans regia TaxID=51240 RepID=A0A2I4F4W3_JUGRE|nr:uncharacterized protein LOC108995563 [Juglans regia]KAF5468456.1 hypothetical protein F2P56_012606 [Juglans regia]